MRISNFARAFVASAVLLPLTLNENNTARPQEKPPISSEDPSALKPKDKNVENANLVNNEIKKLISNKDALRKYVRENINDPVLDRKSTRLNSSHNVPSRMPSSA